MRNILSRPRFFAATAASIAFVATFAVSARAVMQPGPATRVYKIIALESVSQKYQLGQTYEVPVESGDPDPYIEIAAGVWAELMPETSGT